MRNIALCVLLSMIASSALGHGTASAPDAADDARKIVFPDTAGHVTVVLDPHTHSTFSDGHVWPRIRIEEALRDGLDAIAITEHLEYQPHIADVPHPDRNRAYIEATAAAQGADLIVISGAEITREAPAGHINAIFLSDANALLRAPEPTTTDVGAFYAQSGQWPAQATVEAANAQKAFVFWNHPYWGDNAPNGIPVMPPFHRDNAKAGLLHGIEIANGQDYSEEAFQIALDHNLALIGVSDVHDLIDWDYEPHKGGHRPVTLVLAKERTEASIQQALFDRRTVVWFKNLLIGRPKVMGPLLDASLSLHDARYRDKTELLVVSLTNTSDANFQLRNKGKYTFFRNADLIEVPPHATIELIVKTKTRVADIELPFEVLNALTAPKKNPVVTLKTRIE